MRTPSWLVLAVAAAAVLGAVFYLAWRGGESTSTPATAGKVLPEGRLHLARLSQIGEAEGDGPRAFGLIGDLTLGSRGHLIVLDVANQRVGFFGGEDGAGRVVGEKGRGPGEFMSAVALAAGEHGRVYVLDRQNGRIEIMDDATGARIGAFPLHVSGEDICFASGRLFALGVHAGHLLHELSTEDGTVLRSFAPDSAVGDRLMYSYRSSGYLQCGPGDRITFLPLLRPEIVQYAASSGEHLRTLPLPGYVPVRVSRVERGGVRFEAPDADGHDYASSIVPLGDTASLVQYGRIRPRVQTVHEFLSLQSFAVDWRTGSFRPLSPLPRIMAARGDTLLAAEVDPHPHAVRFQASHLDEL